ncbi:hypothetical protein [Haloferula sp. BvORR071]|uniref:hypothetical protein n=1 Tax=Haloferula sp. BvORR071 TaxID=1396141 RepID=UPI0005537117|nr:hypothetical protein [Haloferula sp. BvORR071]
MPEQQPAKQKQRKLGRLEWAIILLLAMALLPWNWLTGPHRKSLILPRGEFNTSFPEGLYPNRTKEIEAWFRKKLPEGTSKSDADTILAQSFSKAITSGNQISIDESSSLGGGYYTKITLVFDAHGRLQDVKVEQHWAYM